MSLNLIINFEKENQSLPVNVYDIWQTPTEITLKVMELKDFDQQLDAYFDWAKEFDEENRHQNDLIHFIEKRKASGFKPSFSYI